MSTTHSFDVELYRSEFLRYHEMAETQQRECNLGLLRHVDGSVEDPLMQHVELYDVVERKYAGFTQILLDMWYGDSGGHPYKVKGLHSVRKPIAKSFTGAREAWGLPEWLYVFVLHRVTGSGINYAKKPSGYNNTILPTLHNCDCLPDMVQRVREVLSTPTPAYTSVGYQFPRFPPKQGFKRGGDRFLVEYLPIMVHEMADRLTGSPEPISLRELGEWMFQWNRDNGLAAFKFQYAAVVADVADFFPELVQRNTPFFWGSNAIECVSFMTPWNSRNQNNLDETMEWAAEQTGNVPYNLEDVACDFIRWIENYVKPGHDYDHLCRDSLWNTSVIRDHPFGRQRAMLDLGLIRSFNVLNVHPSDDMILKEVGMAVDEYRQQARMMG